MVAVDACCYANSIEGKGEDCSVPRLRCGARPFRAPRKEASETRKYGQYGRGRGLQANLFGRTTERYAARGDTQSDRVGDSGFMRLAGALGESEIGFRQR